MSKYKYTFILFIVYLNVNAQVQKSDTLKLVLELKKELQDLNLQNSSLLESLKKAKNEINELQSKKRANTSNKVFTYAIKLSFNGSSNSQLNFTDLNNALSEGYVVSETLFSQPIIGTGKIPYIIQTFILNKDENP